MGSPGRPGRYTAPVMRTSFGSRPCYPAVAIEVVAKPLDARTSKVTAHSQRTDRDNLAALPPKLKARPIGSVSEADMLGFLTDQLKIKERSTVPRMRTTLDSPRTATPSTRSVL